MTVLQVYTLKNCDTCKKALKWLDAQGAKFQNHDIRANGLDRAVVENIVGTLGWETALNRRSATWRQLDDSLKVDINDTKAVELILDAPTLMKRPVFVSGDTIINGFDAKAQTSVELFI